MNKWALRIIDSSTVGMPYEVALSLTQFAPLHDRLEHLNKKIFSSITLPLPVSPACSHHSETPPSPPDYVLHPYTPDPQPALNAILPLYITLY